MTTIGYGSFTPRTNDSRIFIICTAPLGIALVGLACGIIGSTITDGLEQAVSSHTQGNSVGVKVISPRTHDPIVTFISSYLRVVCLCCMRRIIVYQRRFSLLICVVIVMLLAGGGIGVVEHSDWSYFTGI